MMQRDRGMRRSVLTLLATSLLAMTCGCEEGDAGLHVPEAPEKAVAEVVAGQNAFALDLYARLCGGEGNLFLSPFSISTALAMTYAGARGNTEEQMAEVLRFGGNDEGFHSAVGALAGQLVQSGKKAGYRLHVANALWGQKGYGFLESFLDLNQRLYGAGLDEVDFAGHTEAARKAINGWVEEKTNNKIRDLLRKGDLTELTTLVLTNAIYFKGLWAAQFKKRSTRDAPFYLTAEKSVTVPMMVQTGSFRHVADGDLKVLEMPYKGGRLSMVILLPNEVEGLTALEKSLSKKRLAAWLGRLRKREVKVYLPRFKMTARFQLAETLEAMGMNDAFHLPPADFSGMTGRKDLFISKVIHQAFVDVNEEGTEAAAATAVMMRSNGGHRPVFKADHPFLFLIRDTKTGAILFMGRLVDPKA